MEPLVKRAFAATLSAGIRAELIIVDDDSRDGTEEIVRSLAGLHPIKLIIRKNRRGLASAVVEGFGAAGSGVFLVMDGDLQHPPEMIPDLLRRLERDDCDFVIATRYAPGAGCERDWPLHRRMISRLATWLARPLVPLSDPMSGFFAVRRQTWQRAADLNPIGYKIALELYVKGGCSRPAEVPIRFAARTAGASKLGPGQFIQYLRQLAGLYHYRFRRAIRMALLCMFAVVAALAAGRLPAAEYPIEHLSASKSASLFLSCPFMAAQDARLGTPRVGPRVVAQQPTKQASFGFARPRPRPTIREHSRLKEPPYFAFNKGLRLQASTR